MDCLIPRGDGLRCGVSRAFNRVAHLIHTANDILVNLTTAKMEHAPSSTVEITPTLPIMGKLVATRVEIVAIELDRNLRRRVRKVKVIAPAEHRIFWDELDLRDTLAPGLMKEALDWRFFVRHCARLLITYRLILLFL